MLSDELKTSLVKCLKELRLPTVRACYEEQAGQARQESITYDFSSTLAGGLLPANPH